MARQRRIQIRSPPTQILFDQIDDMASSDISKLKEVVGTYPPEVTMLFEQLAHEMREQVRLRLETETGDDFLRLQGEAKSLKFWCNLRQNCARPQPADAEQLK